MRRLVTYTLVLFAVLTAATTARAGIKFTDKEIDALMKGSLVRQPFEGSGKGSTIAGSSFVLVDATPDEVWQALSDVSAWTTIFPNTYQSKVVAAKGSVKAVRMTMGNKLISLNYYLTVNFNKAKWVVNFELNKNKPSDIDAAKGSLRLLPQPGGKTLIVFLAMTKVSFGGLIKLMGNKVIGWIEERLFSVPKKLKYRVYALRAK